MKHIHAFGRPAFALENDLAAGDAITHWSPCTHLGINLGPSPFHARNVYLVLNLHTGCVPPQYHCIFDSFFETAKHGGLDVSMPTLWQQLSGLTVATHILSMEYHDDAPNPAQCMHFGNTTVKPTTESPKPTVAPIFF
jgi:hypothetical protein